MQTLNVAYWTAALRRLSAVFDEEKGRLCALDGAIGDGDHGTSMALGFSEIARRLEAEDFADVGALLTMAGNTFIGSVGGVTGIMFGTLLLEAGKKVKGQTDVSSAGLADMFDAALQAMRARGKAEEGDKSMVDALAPAARALKEAGGQALPPAQALSRASDAAEAGVKATRDMEAKVGRARYQGTKAVGHIDPGAASVAIFFRTLAEPAHARSDGNACNNPGRPNRCRL